MSLIITPDHPEFYPTLHSTLPPGWRSQVDSDYGGCMAARSGSLLLTPLTEAEATEYIYGGEFDELEWLEHDD